MPNLGNAWHLPNSPQPIGRSGMRDPVGPIVPGTAVTIFSGNQFQGGGNPGNQLQAGSTLFFKRATDADWNSLPLLFNSTAGNDKYFSATLPSGTFQTGDQVQYYLRIAYEDHDVTFLHAGGGGSTPTANEAAAQAAPFTYTVEASAVRGEWGPVFPLPNAAIHTHVLPNGLVLMWGRRDTAAQSLDVHECTPFLWNPASGAVTNTPQPTLANGTKINLFCAGHAFLPDGRLLVAGGHLADGVGLAQTTIYDPATNQWTATAAMNEGRWYPTVTTLPNGAMLVLSGSFRAPNGQIVVNDVLQVWSNGAWAPILNPAGAPLNFGGLPLYPHLHVASDGRVFMSGPLAQTYLLRTSGGGQWTTVGQRANAARDYCPTVMYDANKFIYLGGGNDVGTRRPTAEAEVMDLNQAPPAWRRTNPMKFRRRQHNATVLPDGTVLVTGGTQGGGGPENGFNDLNPGQPVRVAELWDPATEQWTELSAEWVDRCYHATTVLLPDATVLSAGGGEYRPDNINDNNPADTHRDAQIFSPPYLFKGNRPTLSAAPASVTYGQAFTVTTPQANQIGRVSWIRLPSVTHSFDQNQRINFLSFTAGVGTLTITAPGNANLSPPGHYMLFLVSGAGVPSVAKIIQIQAVVPAPQLGMLSLAQPETELLTLGSMAADVQVFARQVAVAEAARGTTVVLGITGTCPYGIGACWGGAYEALRQLEGVDLVNPIPNADDSTAEVFLEVEGVPPLDRWLTQFQDSVNGTYELRGVEVTLHGSIEARDSGLFLKAGGPRPEVRLVPLAAADKLQWDHSARARKPLAEGEARAHNLLAANASNLPDGHHVTVTGPLLLDGADYQLHVRQFQV